MTTALDQFGRGVEATGSLIDYWFEAKFVRFPLHEQFPHHEHTVFPPLRTYCLNSKSILKTLIDLLCFDLFFS